MILAASLLLGSYLGWRYADDRSRAFACFGIGWLLVLAAQTTLLLATTDSVRDRDSGEFTTAYPFVCAAILVLGLVVVRLASTIKRRRRRVAGVEPALTAR
jgi:hypothetical protein